MRLTEALSRQRNLRSPGAEPGNRRVHRHAELPPRHQGVDRNAVNHLNDAWHHARKIGPRLNVLVTLRPINIDEVAPNDRTAIWQRLMNKLGVYSRYNGVSFTAAWARESNRDSSGEHLPVLMYIPQKLRAHFETTWASELDNVRTSTSADTSPASPPVAASLWQAFVQAQERSKATGDLNDGIAAGKAYAAFVADFTRPTAKGAA